ncbi:hypothetical protein SUNI508_04959 [Seiridium unicorne]|uniref:Uncharacterized protein n=1 Tax=Seiridium unicorne TaxID=138068 RepID=A0ABR2V734_9PEZI
MLPEREKKGKMERLQVIHGRAHAIMPRGFDLLQNSVVKGQSTALDPGVLMGAPKTIITTTDVEDDVVLIDMHVLPVGHPDDDRLKTNLGWIQPLYRRPKQGFGASAADFGYRQWMTGNTKFRVPEDKKRPVA